MSTKQVLCSIPEIGLDFPSDSLMHAAFAHAQKYCPEEVNNHAARCAYWALLLAKKLPEYAHPQQGARRVNVEDVVLICLLHDLGLASWIVGESDPANNNNNNNNSSTTTSDSDSSSKNPLPGLLSLDKRFEVDGANAARAFVETATASAWDEARLDRLWTAVVLHTTPSIARQAATPEVVLAYLAIEADFFGPYWTPTCSQPPPVSLFSGGDHDDDDNDAAAANNTANNSNGNNGNSNHVFSPPLGTFITVDEYRAVMARFPRLDFQRDGVKRVMCALCRRKPATTVDNFAGCFGKAFGLDGRGFGREEYARMWEGRQSPEFLLETLDLLSRAALDGKE